MIKNIATGSHPEKKHHLGKEEKLVWALVYRVWKLDTLLTLLCREDIIDQIMTIKSNILTHL